MNEQHLTEDDIIRSVADGARFTEAQDRHLQQCPRCRLQAEQLKTSLFRLAKTAKDLAPSPTRGIVLSEKRAAGRPWARTWQWRGVLATGALATLVAAWVWWQSPSGPENLEALITREMEQDERFMAEIISLEEYALPISYADLSGENLPEDDEGFVDFLLPELGEDQPLSKQRNQEVNHVA